MSSLHSRPFRTESGRLLSVLIVIIAVGGIAYLVNERFRSEVDKGYEKLNSWSEEAIAEDPVNFLDFVERRTRDTLSELQTSELTLAREQAKLEVRVSTAGTKISAGRAALEELRTLFRGAEGQGRFPVTWRGQPRDRDFLVDQMISLDTDIEREESLKTAAERTLGAMGGARKRLGDLRARCERQLATLPAERELARLSQLDEKTRRRFAGMKSVIEDGARVNEDPTGLVGLDEIANPNADPTEEAGDREAELRRILEGR